MRYGRSGHSSVAEEVEGKENDEKRLLRHLMKGYERDVRPVRNASTPIVIQLSMTLTQIFDMDEKNQVLTTIIWLDQVKFNSFKERHTTWLSLKILFKYFVIQVYTLWSSDYHKFDILHNFIFKKLNNPLYLIKLFKLIQSEQHQVVCYSLTDTDTHRFVKFAW